MIDIKDYRKPSRFKTVKKVSKLDKLNKIINKLLYIITLSVVFMLLVNFTQSIF